MQKANSLVLFSADWCSSCTPVKKVIEQKRYPVNVLSIDSDEGEHAAHAAGVRQIPALQLEDGTLLTESNAILNILKDVFDGSK